MEKTLRAQINRVRWFKLVENICIEDNPTPKQFTFSVPRVDMAVDWSMTQFALIQHPERGWELLGSDVENYANILKFMTGHEDFPINSSFLDELAGYLRVRGEEAATHVAQRMEYTASWEQSKGNCYAVTVHRYVRQRIIIAVDAPDAQTAMHLACERASQEYAEWQASVDLHLEPCLTVTELQELPSAN